MERLYLYVQQFDGYLGWVWRGCTYIYINLRGIRTGYSEVVLTCTAILEVLGLSMERSPLHIQQFEGYLGWVWRGSPNIYSNLRGIGIGDSEVVPTYTAI